MLIAVDEDEGRYYESEIELFVLIFWVLYWHNSALWVRNTVLSFVTEGKLTEGVSLG